TRLLEIARRFIRRPSFLVRYFDLGTAHFGRDDVRRAFRRGAGSGMQIAKVFDTFFEFLARRCGDREREAYISAVEHIQTGDIRVGERGEPDASTTLGANVRLINGGTDAELLDRLLLAFNTPFYPEVLITTSVMAEGVDLHLNCRHVIHHDLSSPAATLNSPIRGRVKFPQLTAAGRCVFTRSERALQLERRPLSDASSCLRTSADASDASGGRAAA